MSPEPPGRGAEKYRFRGWQVEVVVFVVAESSEGVGVVHLRQMTEPTEEAELDAAEDELVEDEELEGRRRAAASASE